jgi:hypothetical protein
MWLTWGSTSRTCELAICKVIIQKAREDFLISIDRLVVFSIFVLHGIAVRDLCPFSREISSSKRIHEYEAVERSISIVVFFFSFLHRTYATMRELVRSQYEPTPGIDLLAYTSKSCRLSGNFP